MIGRGVATVLEEGLDVGHAQQGRRRRCEEDDGVWPSLGFLVERESGVVCDIGRCRAGLLGHEGLGELADVGKVLENSQVSKISP